jgi:hypothetical protein
MTDNLWCLHKVCLKPARQKQFILYRAWTPNCHLSVLQFWAVWKQHFLLSVLLQTLNLSFTFGLVYPEIIS